MPPSGFRWSLRPAGDQWRWRVEGRDDRLLLDGGLAPTRTAAAALMVRAIARAAGRR